MRLKGVGLSAVGKKQGKLGKNHMYDVLNLMGKQLCLGTGQQGGIFRGWHRKALIE